MKKIIYSGWLKAFAVLLFLAGIVLGAITATKGIIDFYDGQEQVYSFERDFSESRYLSSLVNEPENLVYTVYHELYFDGYDSYGIPVYKDTYVAPNSAAVAKNLQKRLESFYYDEEVNYYIQWNDLKFTNCDAATPEALMECMYFSYVKRDSDGDIERSSTGSMQINLMEGLSRYDSVSNITVSCSVKEEVVNAYKLLWEKQEKMIINTVVQTLICAGAALLALVYLICVCGKDKKGEYKCIWLDNIWLEVHLAAIGGLGLAALAACVYTAEEYMYSYFPLNFVYLVTGTAAALGSLGILTAILSIIRNIKTRRLPETSITFRILRWLLRLCTKMAKWMWRKTKAFWSAVVRLLSKKTGVILIGMLLAYTALIGFFGIVMPHSPIWLVLGILLFGFASFLAACRARDLDEIKNGVSEIRKGNVAHKIPEPKCEDMKALALDINSIAKGLDESVAAKVKAERLRTELITNVSHDLKTPITSIISYTELLSKIQELPEEARDYVAVIAKKGDRLKKLTQDLFDISKVQSGNETVVLEKLDVVLLIQQALGEQDNEIRNSGLTFCVEAQKELFITADGGKMSRVISNLLSNILKYTMKNTRVFLTAKAQGEFVVMEFKNISAYPLDFNAEEITQRFVRGDDARSTEGNGLGLAIAKSYTELCGGTFEIATDGDLFKAILKFRK